MQITLSFDLVYQINHLLYNAPHLLSSNKNLICAMRCVKDHEIEKMIRNIRGFILATYEYKISLTYLYCCVQLRKCSTDYFLV